MYRIRTHKDDPAMAIYFSPSDTTTFGVYLPIYDEGELVSPAHWGDNWPVSRRTSTVMGQINDEHLHAAPGQICLLNPPEPSLLSSGTFTTIDALGHENDVTVARRAWLI